MRKWIQILTIVVFIITSLSVKILAANSNIEGTVKDAKTGEPLIGANVIVDGTSMGAATNIYGRYTIKNVIPGSYTISISYIGYQSKKVKISVKESAHIEKDFSLEPVSIEGKIVVVTAQASGQTQAINQQLASDQIINVVSSDRIQALPDANAAESVGRLPGVSLLRSGGEAYAVVIRGLQPKYNAITIDGVQMGSSSSSSRYTDLSMISSSMLGGIEVYKTITPDMDADVIGGTVNFEMREAQVKEPGVPRFSFVGQGGYNNLSDAYNKFNNYKYVVTAEDRFWGNRFGVFSQIDIERKNLSSNELGASYDHYANSTTQYVTTGLTLNDIPRDRQRYNGALVLDYRLPNGKIKFTNFFSSGTTDTKNYNESFDLSSNIRYYGLSASKGSLNNIVNVLDFQQDLPVFHVDLKLSHVYSENKSPDSWNANFQQTSAGLNQFINKTNVNPQDIPKAANNDYSKATLYQFNLQNSFTRQRNLAASLDLSTNLNLSRDISAVIKFGGKFKHLYRSYNTEVFNGTLIGTGVSDIIAPYFSLPVDQAANMNYWVDPNFSYGKFLGGNYTMIAPLNYGMLNRLASFLDANVQKFADQNQASWYGKNSASSITNNYNGYENKSAFYLMSVIKFGQQISLIPGIRYQNLQTIYTGPRGFTNALSYQTYDYYDTTVTQNHGYWLPDVSLRYQPFSWFDIRLSYSNTLAYPDYSSIIPKINVGLNAISWNNYTLSPGRSTNYDMYLSFYNNSIGLFTVGPFLKQISNLIYSWSYYVSGAEALQYMPAGLSGSKPNPTATYSISTYINNSYVINNYGIELDWQTHFWYLPGPLSGLVFSANYTHIFSKAQYPLTYTKVTGRSITYIDTSFTDRLIDQPADILNLTLGFDYKDFSIRVALLYQSDVFTDANFWPQLRSYTSPYRRWDIAVKQALPWYGLQLYMSINNLNGAKDISIIQGGGVPISEQDYGLTADFGLRFEL